jgi:hypothetical protein
MSSLSVYFKIEQPFEYVVAELAKVFCMDLAIEQTDMGLKCQFYCLDVEFFLAESYGMQDEEIEFSKFNYSLGFIKLNRGGYSEEYNNMYTSIAKHYTKKIAEVLHVECVLIEDCQDIVMQVNGQKSSDNSVVRIFP